ncbi:MAG TPA: DUF3153 domain-containing protein [Leptolyngbyaceae cyanobacterium M65_K2018_010]|nr:DUF3153 domain-containing protein [Leptolyngbyaceae cyanobacterium M65_K2018_010]
MGRRVGQHLGLVLGLALCLSGCFQSDLTLRFDHQNHGQLSQVIDLGERGTALAQGSLTPWLKTLEQRVKRLGGELSQDPSTIRLTVPFGTPQDLVTRFNQLFAEAESSPAEAGWQRLTAPGLGLIPFKLEVDQQSWGLAARTHLVYDLDLSDFAPSGSSPSGEDHNRGSAFFFCLQTPWGIRQLRPGGLTPLTALSPVTRWQLQLGQVNHIDVIFWLPNVVGLGALGIFGLVLLGYFVRYRWLSPPSASSPLSFGQK